MCCLKLGAAVRRMGAGGPRGASPDPTRLRAPRWSPPVASWVELENLALVPCWRALVPGVKCGCNIPFVGPSASRRRAAAAEAAGELHHAVGVPPVAVVTASWNVQGMRLERRRACGLAVEAMPCRFAFKQVDGRAQHCSKHPPSGWHGMLICATDVQSSCASLCPLSHGTHGRLHNIWNRRYISNACRQNYNPNEEWREFVPRNNVVKGAGLQMRQKVCVRWCVGATNTGYYRKNIRSMMQCVLSGGQDGMLVEQHSSASGHQ
eukprot:365995-Chlamydomonas_euryale.AAC.9